MACRPEATSPRGPMPSEQATSTEVARPCRLRPRLRTIGRIDHADQPGLAAHHRRWIFEPNSDATNLEARCRTARPCLEGSESRNRLSETLAWPPFFSGGEP